MPVTKLRSEQLNVDNDFDIQSHKLLNVSTPTGNNDAANKAYVDNASQGLRNFKDSVRAVSTTNLTLSGTQTVDGVALNANDRILVNGQTTGSANGIYVVASGAWARSSDCAVSADVTEGLTCVVDEGTTYADTLWTLLTTGAITLGTTSILWTKLPSGTTYTGAGIISVSGSTVNTTVASGDIVVGNGSNVGAAVAMSGDVTITNAGVTTVNNTSGSGFTKYGDFITRETPSGTVNGANATFTLANTPVAGTEELFLNGILQEPGAGNDYTISGATITYLTAPLTGDRIRCTYEK